MYTDVISRSNCFAKGMICGAIRASVFRSQFQGSRLAKRHRDAEAAARNTSIQRGKYWGIRDVTLEFVPTLMVVGFFWLSNSVT